MRLLLIILDGWGERPAIRWNPLKQAKLPSFELLHKGPHSLLHASGEAVGLPEGMVGNSEVGHLTLGAGRVLPTAMFRITQSIHDKTLFAQLDSHFKKGKRIHLMGLLSNGGVHSHIDHIIPLLKHAQKQRKEVYVHLFSDGRDMPIRSATTLFKLIMPLIKENIKLASLCGRYYAMDRDKRWERTENAYSIISAGAPISSLSVEKYLQEQYSKGVTDEFILPTALTKYGGISDNDCILFWNFREDRARQLSHLFVKHHPKLAFATMTEYEKGLPVTVLFPPVHPENTLADVLSLEGKTQLRIAETEKYAHITYFFNGLRESPVDEEERILHESPKVATYDLAPAMRAYAITRTVLEKVMDYDFVLVNFANADMVGHTGNMNAALLAAVTVDECIGQIMRHAQRYGYIVMITADHGNIEQMQDEHGEPQTMHTTNKVPCFLFGKNCSLRDGGLSDIAPTILQLFGIPKPKEMTGRSLIK